MQSGSLPTSKQGGGGREREREEKKKTSSICNVMYEINVSETGWPFVPLYPVLARWYTGCWLFCVQDLEEERS